MPRKKRRSSTGAPVSDNGASSSDSASNSTTTTPTPQRKKNEKNANSKSKSKSKQKASSSSSPSSPIFPFPKVLQPSGFTVVPIQLPSSGDSSSSSSPHFRFLYFKPLLDQNSSQSSKAKSQEEREEEEEEEQEEEKLEADADRTLLIQNPIYDCTAEDLERIFSRCGKIRSIAFKSKPQPGSKRLKAELALDLDPLSDIYVHLVFEEVESVAVALATDWASLSSQLTEQGDQRGVEKWISDYHKARPDPAKVQAQVDAFMFEFDKKQEIQRKEEEASWGKPDEDGFILVQSKRGRKRLSDGTIAVTGTRVTKKLIAKGKQERVLSDFYRFQKRELRRQELADLRVKFEEDKKKIAMLRAARKFKPF
ncbi:Ribosomal RNA-processing protein 7 A [Balamuthia mandrillaris]